MKERHKVLFSGGQRGTSVCPLEQGTAETGQHVGKCSQTHFQTVITDVVSRWEGRGCGLFDYSRPVETKLTDTEVIMRA